MGLAVYIHIPFCVKKCNYCDFPSYPGAGYDVGAYLAALGLEMDLYRDAWLGKEVSTLFIGGGTPSILTEAQLESLFGLIHSRFTLEEDAEVTFEGNPGTLDAGKFGLLREGGVNRLSLGAQSLDDEMLKGLGRIHSSAEALRAFELARAAGFKNINLDLMHGLPGQSEGAWQDTLRRAVKLKPEHLSVYGLIIEAGTPFGQAFEEGYMELPEEEVRASMMQWGSEYLSSNGYTHYEISNYARPGRECRHNIVYWQNETYLGFGAGAASYSGGCRRTNTPDVIGYMAKIQRGMVPVAELEKPDLAQQMAETMFLGLRMLNGVERARFALRFGRELDEIYGTQISFLVGRGLLENSSAAIWLTNRGVPLANEVFCEFLP